MLTSQKFCQNITFTKEGKQLTVDYYYPWLPARCKLYDKWGHGEVVCATKGKGKKCKEVTGSPKSSNESAVRVVKPLDEEILKVSDTVVDVIRAGSSSKNEISEQFLDGSIGTSKEITKEKREGCYW